MQVYTRQESHYFCGHWNGSPLQIGDIVVDPYSGYPPSNPGPEECTWGVV